MFIHFFYIYKCDFNKTHVSFVKEKAPPPNRRKIWTKIIFLQAPANLRTSLPMFQYLLRPRHYGDPVAVHPKTRQISQVYGTEGIEGGP